MISDLRLLPERQKEEKEHKFKSIKDKFN